MAFWDISSPEVATPPALAALPGPYSILAPRKTSTPSGAVDMFEPSLTHLHPFLTRILASSAVISFWVAEGKARSHGACQGLLPGMNSALGYFLQYSDILPRRLFFKSITQASFSMSIPSGS